MMHKEIKEVVRLALSHGFVRIKSSKGHIKLRRNGRTVVMSCSPSCPHAAKNARADVMAIIKGEND